MSEVGKSSAQGRNPVPAGMRLGRGRGRNDSGTLLVCVNNNNGAVR